MKLIAVVLEGQIKLKSLSSAFMKDPSLDLVPYLKRNSKKLRVLLHNRAHV